MNDIIGAIKDREAEIKSRFGVKRIGVFGSTARNEQGPRSDVDVIVDFHTPTFDNFMDLSFYLEELLGREIDLVTTKGISPYLVDVVEKEVVWCG